MVQTVITSYQYFSLLGQVVIGIVFLLYLGKIFLKNKGLDNLRKKISPYTYHLIFFLSLVATLASLFLSEVAKFQPCILCWYQRIAMYPQPLILYTAIVRNERVLKPYLLILNIMGAVVAAYHYALQIAPKGVLLPCSKELTGISVSCVEGYKFYMGYMSFPLMSLTVFVLIIILLLLDAKDPKRSK